MSTVGAVSEKEIKPHTSLYIFEYIFISLTKMTSSESDK